MNHKITQEIFYRWLKSNNIYGQYCANFKSTDPILRLEATFRGNYEKERDDYLGKNPYERIMCAFFWEGTKEGREFWHTIHNNWICFCSNYISGKITKQIQWQWK